MAKNNIELIRSFVVDKLPKGFDHKPIIYIYEVNSVTIKAGHWSGKFNGSLDDLLHVLKYLMDEYDLDYLTTTETQQRGARKAIRKLFKKYCGTKFTGEYAMIYRTSTFKPTGPKKPIVSVMTAVKNWAAWRQMYVGHFNLMHKELKLRFRILDVHGPSGIEYGASFRPGNATEVAQKGWARLGRKLKRLAKRNPKVVQVVVGDSNGDQKLTFWLQWFEAKLDAKSVWNIKDAKREGSHGSRLIDGAWIKL